MVDDDENEGRINRWMMIRWWDEMRCKMDRVLVRVRRVKECGKDKDKCRHNALDVVKTNGDEDWITGKWVASTMNHWIKWVASTMNDCVK